MRIAIYHNLPSGGGKRALFQMTKGLVERHDVDVYALSSADHEFCDLRPYARRHVVFPFAPLRAARRPFGRLNQAIRIADLRRLGALQRGIASRIDAGSYDVLFAHSCRYGQSPALLPFLRTPSAYYCAEPPRWLYDPPIERPYERRPALGRLLDAVDPLPGWYRRTLRRLDARNTRAATVVLTNSRFSRERLREIYGVAALPGRLGVDADLFRPARIPKRGNVFSVGELKPHKGFDFVIRSLARIDAIRRPTLAIACNAADPREHAYLRELAASLGVRVQVRPRVGDDELVRLYNEAAVTVYAPMMEPFGLVPLESMACGTPVIGVDEAGVRETVRHGESGLLVERDPASFARAIASLVADPGLRAEYGRRGRAHVEAEWSWDRSVRELEEHLRAAAEKGGPRSGCFSDERSGARDAGGVSC